MLLKAQGAEPSGLQNLSSGCSFIVQLLHQFEDQQSMYLCLELARHGDLFMNMRQLADKHFDIEIVRFFTAEIAIALQWLHEKRIAFRDLKQVGF
jgi:serine/threonine protein kinase